MKGIKVLVSVVATFIITWLFVSLLVYLLSDDTFKQACKEEGVLFFMFVLGWIPSVLVGVDLDTKLK